MAYGRTWHEGRTIRHHNLVTATQGPITGPIDRGRGRSNTAGKGKGKPKTAGFPGVLANINTTSALTSSVAAVALEAEQYDRSNYHSTVTNTSRLTVPATGLYRFTSGFYTTTPEVFGHRVDGSTFPGCARTVSSTTGDDSSNLTSAIVSLTAGQYFEIYKETTGTPTVSAFFGGVEPITAGTQYALVNKTGSQSYTTPNTPVSLTWDNEVADVGGWHDNVTNNSRLTVPSGVTLVRVMAAVSNNGTTNAENLLTMLKNGANVRGRGFKQVELNGQKFLSVVSAPLVVSASDYFEIRFTSGANETIPAADYVWAFIEEIPTTYKRAFVYKSSGQAISAATPTAVTWNAEEYDTDGFHDNVTNNTRLTIPAGVKQARLSFGGVNAGGAGDFSFYVQKNGGDAPGCPRDESNTTSTDTVNGLGAWMDVVEGDYFEVFCFSAAAVTLGTDNENWFAIEAR